MISKNMMNIMIFVCLRTKSNIRFTLKKKGEQPCSPWFGWVVGDDGLEPPTYAL